MFFNKPKKNDGQWYSNMVPLSVGVYRNERVIYLQLSITVAKKEKIVNCLSTRRDLLNKLTASI